MNTLRHSDAKVLSLNGAPMLLHVRVDLGDHRRGPRGEPLLQRRPGVLEVLERRLGGGERERVADERAREVGHADRGDRRVAVLPLAAVERVHELALARDHADREPAADHLAVGSEVGLDAEQALRAARVRAEAGDDLVEDRTAMPCSSVSARTSRRNSTGWKSGRRLCTGSTMIAASSSARDRRIASDSGVP